MPLIRGTNSAVMTTERRRDRISKWVAELRDRAGRQEAEEAVAALANESARILWAVLAKERYFDPGRVSVKHEAPAMAGAAMAG